MHKIGGDKNIQKTIVLLENINSNWELTLKEHKLTKHDFIDNEWAKNFLYLSNFLFSIVFKHLHIKDPQFPLKKFTITISMKDSKGLVKLFYKKNDCEPVAQQKRTLKDMKTSVRLLAAVGLEKIIDNFKKISSFDVQSGRER